MARKISIGILGFGRMGWGFAAALAADGNYRIVAICDTNAGARAEAARLFPRAGVTADAGAILADPAIEAVGLFTLADARPGQLRQALAADKHVLAEKPLAADARTEWQLVRLIEKAERRGQMVAVNLFNRNAWYHQEIRRHIAAGEIGSLAIVRVCHMTPGFMPTEGHAPEGPPFHDCGMHYVDVARWYAGAEYRTWHAQGMRMWNYKEPWWVQCHGTFDNGVVFDITQGFVYGHLAKDLTHNCYVDLIGTQGIARMRHDFKNATIEIYGTRRTHRRTAPFNDKKLDVMVRLFARSLRAGRNLGFPTARDAVIASETAWKMLQNALKNGPPAVGTPREMEAILERRRTLRSGFGLPLHAGSTPAKAAPAVAAPCDMANLGRHAEAAACGEDLCGPGQPGEKRS